MFSQYRMCKEGQTIPESSSDDNADYIPDTHHEDDDQPDNTEVGDDGIRGEASLISVASYWSNVGTCQSKFATAPQDHQSLLVVNLLFTGL